MKKQYQLSEFQFYDGEEFITFNLIDINTEYKGIKCHALFNWFNCTYYADDVYTIIKEV